MNLSKLYSNRFSQTEALKRRRMWEAINGAFLRKYVHRDDTVLDIAAGSCEFINTITCAEDSSVHPRRRIAVDCNPDMKLSTEAGVITYCQSATDMSNIPDNSVDVAFTSNFFEHLSRESILSVLTEWYRVLRGGGCLLILQPNFRFAYKNYWDFFDHITPLTDRSLSEAILMSGEKFRIEEMIPQFLPYTTKSRLPQAPWLIRLYLRVSVAWPLLGKQLFCVVRKD